MKKENKARVKAEEEAERRKTLQSLMKIYIRYS
jgi:hypothetical protein